MGAVKRSGRVALAALAASFLLTACSASPSIERSSDGRIIAVMGQSSDAFETALAEGTALWGPGGCMAISVNGTSYLVVFPHGTKIVENDEVELPSGNRIAAGDEVALGGGFRSPSTTTNHLEAIPEECLTEEVFWASGDSVE